MAEIKMTEAFMASLNPDDRYFFEHFTFHLATETCHPDEGRKCLILIHDGHGYFWELGYWTEHVSSVFDYEKENDEPTWYRFDELGDPIRYINIPIFWAYLPWPNSREFVRFIDQMTRKNPKTCKDKEDK